MFLLAILFHWSAAHPAAHGEITIRLVRGSVHVVRGDSITLAAQRSVETVDLIVRESADHIELVARYPYDLEEAAECLPPIDERGDFYHHEGRIDIELTVPDGWRVQSEILESPPAR